jgi:hypothetical protein
MIAHINWVVSGAKNKRLYQEKKRKIEEIKHIETGVVPILMATGSWGLSLTREGVVNHLVTLLS